MRKGPWLPMVCIVVGFLCFGIFSETSLAHPGRTDSQGGHYDHSTGEYHFHTDDSNPGTGGGGSSAQTVYPGVTLEPKPTQQASMVRASSLPTENKGRPFVEVLLVMVPVLAIFSFLLKKIVDGPWWAGFAALPLILLIGYLFLSGGSVMETILIILGVLFILYRAFIWFFSNWKTTLKRVVSIYTAAQQSDPGEDNEYYFFHVIEEKYPLVVRGPRRRLYDKKQEVLYGYLLSAAHYDELGALGDLIRRYSLPSAILCCLLIENQSIVRKYRNNPEELYRRIEEEVIGLGFSQYCPIKGESKQEQTPPPPPAPGPGVPTKSPSFVIRTLCFILCAVVIAFGVFGWRLHNQAATLSAQNAKLEEEIADLNKQNTDLHNLVSALNNRLTVVQEEADRYQADLYALSLETR